MTFTFPCMNAAWRTGPICHPMGNGCCWWKWTRTTALGALPRGSDGRQFTGPPGGAARGGLHVWRRGRPTANGCISHPRPEELYHIWRQRFPDGQPEQMTSGLTEEEGIAMAPDGRSFVTAVALRTFPYGFTMRGASGRFRSEGNAAYPKFTPDGKKLCYRIVKAVPTDFRLTDRDPGEVWVADLESGHSERLAPGFQPLDYDISADGRQVVMEALTSEGKPRLWLAPFDRRSPPRQIPNVEGRTPRFGPSGEIFFAYEVSGFVYRVRPDGTGLRKALEQPSLLSGWRFARRPVDLGMGSDSRAAELADVRRFRWQAGLRSSSGGHRGLRWSPDGDSL